MYNTIFPSFHSSIDIKNNYSQLGASFIEKYISSNQYGISYSSTYYASDALISLHIHKSNGNNLYEILGHTNLKSKLNEFQIDKIRFYSIISNFQPLENNKILINFYGKAEINNVEHNVMCNLVLSVTNNDTKIINQILNISI